MAKYKLKFDWLEIGGWSGILGVFLSGGALIAISSSFEQIGRATLYPTTLAWAALSIGWLLLVLSFGLYIERRPSFGTNPAAARGSLSSGSYGRSRRSTAMGSKTTNLDYLANVTEPPAGSNHHKQEE